MTEISTALAILWTIGTFIFASGFGWAGIKYGQRTNEASMREVKADVKEIQKCTKELKERLRDDELNYMTRVDCDNEQVECGKHRDYHESQLLIKVQEIKELMVEMDHKREDTRVEMANAIRTLGVDLRTENDQRYGSII